MHVNIKDLHAGAWLMANELYAQFIGIVEDNTVEMQFLGEDVTSLIPSEALRPIFVNRNIIQRCGFTLNGNVYSNGIFEITIGGASNIYKITGHRVKRPFVTHLLSQLHIFQNIYRFETDEELVFKPDGL
jgi:hypothetical protein